MRPRNENGAEAPTSATATLDSPSHRHETGTAPMVATSSGSGQTRPERFPVVIATRYPPAGRRRRWLLLTADCPWCCGQHAHTAATLDTAGGARRAGCQPGRTYWLAIGDGRHG